MAQEFRGDDEIVMAAVAQNGIALYYATEALRADREIVQMAVAQNGLAPFRGENAEIKLVAQDWKPLEDLFEEILLFSTGMEKETSFTEPEDMFKTANTHNCLEQVVRVPEEGRSGQRFLDAF